MINYSEIGKKIHNLSIEHPLWVRKLELTYARIALAEPSQVVCVIGPPRVGKSRMSQTIRRMLNFSGVGINDPQSLSIGVRASNCNTNGAFSTKTFARKAVAALNHPIFARDEFGEQKPVRILETEGGYWLALERGLSASGKRYVFIDEAQNVCRAIGKHGAGGVLDAWKCIAEDSGVVLVLTGTYQLHRAMQESTHILGRKSFVHFPRYRLKREDIEGFNSILEAYTAILPLAPELKNLRKYSEYLYSGSLGCIGILERWLRDALAEAMAHKGRIGIRDLENSRTCDSDLRATLEETLEGEKMMLASGVEEQTSPLDSSQPVVPNCLEKEAQSESSKAHNAFVCNAVRRKSGERVQGEIHV